ncbi:response regulator [Tenacibaculum maritimum]|uniref:response regulator n=1 Tax=Tenacibaculum maritimum TaxID=107401 RepID=UPI0012E670DC|nr:response regulator transcription factor [Tenacibaculum maritimum]MCD9564092.1 response regulator transcription factor [Tenacibaculum maritimum]MCD9566566.1 response regulator transcription factor [Tenacibaculum maritimum]MCD9579615.1 response regulator transcription factor [Tenacibaculum maritimum]MCD9582220.1 response regulator transcription factor [Tenacibaculum maritimum]MCD9585188.1 response regulator transcription factor [Tenacibaculum maritimum]
MTVHIADDCSLIADGFESLFKATQNTSIKIIGRSSNGEELIEWLHDNIVDIVILDIDMPKKNGIEVLQYLKKYAIAQKVIVVSEYLLLDFIKKTMDNGAEGYISKQFAYANILEGLEEVYKGNTYLSTDVQELLVQEYLNFYQGSNSEFARLILGKSLSKQKIRELLLHAKRYDSVEIPA